MNKIFFVLFFIKYLLKKYKLNLYFILLLIKYKYNIYNGSKL